MPNQQYPIQEERILQGQNKGYFFISADKSKITYNASGKTYGFESEKEKQRAYFLVQLIEEYGYSENEIQLDAEVIIDGKPVVFDLAIFRLKTPLYGINIRQSDLSQQDFFDLRDNAKSIPCLSSKPKL